MPSDIPQDVFYEAAEWYATLYADDCSDSGRHAWQHWLNSHPLHQDAWQRVEQIHAQFHVVDKTVASSVLSRKGAERRQVLKLLVLATLLGGGVYTVPWQTYAADYRTAKGESQSWTVANGVLVTLNTDSALQRHEGQENPLGLRLLQGECLLENSGGHPIDLQTPQGAIAVSAPCRIDVRSDHQESILAVFNGEVLIHAASRPQDVRRVAAGQQIRFTASTCQTLEPVDAFRQSWRDGVVLADNMRLDSLMREYSRYHNGYFPVDDDAAALRISGAFPLQDSPRFFSALTRTLPVVVDQRFSWWITLRSR